MYLRRARLTLFDTQIRRDIEVRLYPVVRSRHVSQLMPLSVSQSVAVYCQHALKPSILPHRAG